MTMTNSAPRPMPAQHPQLRAGDRVTVTGLRHPGLRDMKHLRATAVPDAKGSQAVVLGALAIAILVLLHSLVATLDRNEAARAADMQRAFNAGFAEGSARVLCQGIKRDRLTGEAIK
jgi:hypothetical protein